MLDADPHVRAPVILERLRAEDFSGGITILKDHLQVVRLGFLAACALSCAQTSLILASRGTAAAVALVAPAHLPT